MNKIEQMLQELCPNGVEYLSLGKYIEIYTGVQFNKRDMSDVGTYPVLNGGINPSGFTERYNEEKDTITISQGGASAGYVNWMDCKFWAGAHCFVVRPNNKRLNNRYLYFLLKNSEQILMQSKHGAGIPGLNRDKVKNLIVPVPPLLVQEEIVRILDHFTELTASLQAELQARQEQYEYYRNKLLTFAKIGGGTQSVTWMKMSEIGDFYGGLSGKSKSDFENGNSKYVTYMNVYKNLSLNIHTNDMVKIAKGEKQNTIQQGDVLFTGSSETPDECGMSSVVTEEISEPIYLNSFCFGFRPYDKSLFFPDFLKHLLRSKAMRAEITKTANGVTRFNVSKKIMGKILLPIPPYKEQKRLATILDKFETLVNDLSQGLPAEIVAVQEQYEYYRNKLLTFNCIKSN